MLSTGAKCQTGIELVVNDILVQYIRRVHICIMRDIRVVPRCADDALKSQEARYEFDPLQREHLSSAVGFVVSVSNREFLAFR